MQVLALSMGCRGGALIVKMHPENQNLEGNGERGRHTYKHLQTDRFQTTWNTLSFSVSSIILLIYFIR